MKLFNFNYLLLFSFLEINHSFSELQETFLLRVWKSSTLISEAELYSVQLIVSTFSILAISRTLCFVYKEVECCRPPCRHTVWLPRRGFCITQLQHPVQVAIRRAALSFHHQIQLPEWSHSCSAFPMTCVSARHIGWGYYSPGIAGLAPGVARMGARFLLDKVYFGG